MMYPLLQKYNTKIFPLSKFFFHQSQNILGFYPCVLGSFLKPSMTISEQNWHSTIALRQQQCCWCHPQAMNDTVYTDSRRIKASLGSQVEYCQIFKAPSQAMIIREMIGNKQKAEGNFDFFFIISTGQVPGTQDSLEWTCLTRSIYCGWKCRKFLFCSQGSARLCNAIRVWTLMAPCKESPWL